ncbi:MAG: hypothetical protein GEU92_17020 [Alphaproteobacteria bacterium]|nr:hypothetical protein [Alphaproteobacteria bacterium]
MARTNPKRFLHGAVGAGDLDNRPEDVIATKRMLRDMGLYKPRPEGLGDDIDAEFDAALRRFQKERGLIEDGTLLPGGETERNLVAARSGEGLDPGPSPEQIRPRGSVGEGGENDPEAVAVAKRAFGALGRYPYDRTRPPPPYIDAKLVDAIRGLQHETGLHPDGRIDPDGKTVDALRRAVATQRTRQKTLPNGKRLRPGETQVAVAPLLLAAVPPLLGIMARTAAPHLARGIGIAAGGAAGQAAIEAGKKQGPKYEIIQNPPPSSPPPYPADSRNPKHNIETFPADGPKMPDRTEFPLKVPAKPAIFIFPDLSDSLPQATILHANRSKKETELDTLNAQIAIQRQHRDWVHLGGGYKLGLIDLDGDIPPIEQLQKKKEKAIPGPGGAEDDFGRRLGDSRPGSRLPDLLYGTPNGRLVAIQTVDADKDGNPTDKELQAAESLRRLGITVYLVPKSRMVKRSGRRQPKK